MLNVILFFILFTNITGGLQVNVFCFLIIYSKQSWISDAEYEPLGNSNSSFDAGVDILNLFFCMTFIIFHV